MDAAASSTDPDPANHYAAEHNFRLYYTGSEVDIADDSGTNLATVTTDTSLTTLSVFDNVGAALGSQTLTNDVSVDGTLQNQYLGGTYYLWLPVFQNGFSNNTLGIDNVSADLVTPEPGTLALMGLGIAAAGLWRRKRA